MGETVAACIGGEESVPVGHGAIARLVRVPGDLAGLRPARAPSREKQFQGEGQRSMDLTSPRRRQAASDDVGDRWVRAVVSAVMLFHEMPLDQRITQRGGMESRDAVQV